MYQLENMHKANEKLMNIDNKVALQEYYRIPLN